MAKKVGRRLSGTARRHRYVWLGRGVGNVCGRCGLPEPRPDHDEVECVGMVNAGDATTARMRGEALPNLLLATSWQDMLTKGGDRMNPAWVSASRAAAVRAVAPLGLLAKTNLARAVEDAVRIYGVLPNHEAARRRSLACCLFATKMAKEGHLDPTNQAVLQGIAILQAAQDDEPEWGYVPEPCQGMAAKMIREALRIGYYGGRPSNIRPG